MTTPCDWPTDDGERCLRPAEWHTDDLGEHHHLCEPCNREAMRSNDFAAEEIQL